MDTIAKAKLLQKISDFKNNVENIQKNQKIIKDYKKLSDVNYKKDRL